MNPKLESIDRQIACCDHAIARLRNVENTIASKAKPIPGEKKLNKILTGMITEQLETARKAIINGAKEGYELSLARYNFFESIDKDLNDILYKTAGNVDKHIENFYNKGKSEGFKLMEVKSYFGPADKQALFNLKNYNFDLIRSIDTGLRNNIRTEVWRGVARGDSIPQVASRIRELNLEPIPAGNRMMSPVERAKNIARTETMRARNTGTKMSLKNYGVTMVEIPESGTEGDWDCECPDLVEGSPYPIDEVPDLPAHPNCTHTYAPASEPFAEPVDVPEGEIVDLTENS
ncbi:MAG: hypothetical protein A4E25_00022 [Methanobacterium sp. PtaB.Bin024]|nr:MAG: hypothetical protein A4E25_00022 [Methanobacterium sp. PtaB.Bin024]